MDNKAVTASSKPSKLQRYIFWWILLAVLWLIVGKSLFGAVGWLTFILLFTVAPFLMLYGLVLWLVFIIRNKRTGYVMSSLLEKLSIALLASLAVFGFVVVDGGDTRESGKSALTSVFGVNMQNGADSYIMNLSGTLTNWSLFAIIILLPTVLVVALVEKRRLSR